MTWHWLLAVIAETEEELLKRLNVWKENVESKGMRVNMNKTKVMISGEGPKVRQKLVRVCSKGVGRNSLQCTSCQKWVHKNCSGIKGSTLKVAKSFVQTDYLHAGWHARAHIAVSRRPVGQLRGSV